MLDRDDIIKVSAQEPRIRSGTPFQILYVNRSGTRSGTTLGRPFKYHMNICK